MSGRRHTMDSAGSSYEDCAQLFVGRLASLVRVPREKDFGIDFYWQPRTAAGPRTETVTELASLQVKGGAEALTYGGMNDKGEWREYEFSWLRSLITPIYLAKVNAECTVVEVFSLWPMWLILWRHTPFEMLIQTRPVTQEPQDWREPQAAVAPQGPGHGDGLQWTVDVGQPILRLTADNTKDPTFRAKAVLAMRTWIAADRLTLMRFQQFIPVLAGITGWRPDPPEVTQTRIWQFWDARPGANIQRLSQTAAPILINLGAHLQWQNNRAAYALIPILEWLDGEVQLDPMGQGLLKGLRETQSRGSGPNEQGPSGAA